MTAMNPKPLSYPRSDVTGVVLAGGRGQRMGGVDKGLATLADKPMVAHVLEVLHRQVGAVMINANRSIDLAHIRFHSLTSQGTLYRLPAGARARTLTRARGLCRHPLVPSAASAPASSSPLRTEAGEGYPSAHHWKKRGNDEYPDGQDPTKDLETACRLGRREKNKVAHHDPDRGRQ